MVGKPERYAFWDIEQYDHSCFDGLIETYKKYLQGILKSALDVRVRTRALARFFKWLEMHGITSLESLQPQDIYNEYIDASDKDMFRKVIRGFFRYAYSHKLLERDYTLPMETIPYPHGKSHPFLQK